MSQTKRIKAAQGRYVQHPDNGHRMLAEEGEHVEMNQYWHRRLADQDIEIIEEPVEVEATKPQTKESN